MELNDDPVIDAIRETRHQISEECGHDPQKLIDYYVALQKKLEFQLLQAPVDDDQKIQPIAA